MDLAEPATSAPGKLIFPTPAFSWHNVALPPMSIDLVVNAIAAALSAGVLAGAKDGTQKAVVDAYEAVKSLLSKKTGNQSAVMTALGELEANHKRSSEGRKLTLSEELAHAGIGSDQELLSAAQSLNIAVQNLKTAQSAVNHGRDQITSQTTSSGHKFLIFIQNNNYGSVNSDENQQPNAVNQAQLDHLLFRLFESWGKGGDLS